MLTDTVLALLAAPLVDVAVTRVFPSLQSRDIQTAALEWIRDCERQHPSVRVRLDEPLDDGSCVMRLGAHNEAVVLLRIVRESDVLLGSGADVVAALSASAPAGTALAVLLICVDETDPAVGQKCAEIQALASERSDILCMESSWVAALCVERVRPLMTELPWDFNASDRAPYFASGQVPVAKPIGVQRSAARMQSMLGLVVDDPDGYNEKWRRLQAEDPYQGTILLCTTFLPPVTFSDTAVVRYWKARGASDQVCEMIIRTADAERAAWRRHIATHKRFDIYDKRQLEEYIKAPEYYQVPLTREELSEQLTRMIELFAYENYTVCLTAESVNATYELHGPELQLRMDRRNKGEPRSGRISGLVFSDPGLSDVFEREFWSTYRTGELEMKDKTRVASWLREKFDECAA